MSDTQNENWKFQPKERIRESYILRMVFLIELTEVFLKLIVIFFTFNTTKFFLLTVSFVRRYMSAVSIPTKNGAIL